MEVVSNKLSASPSATMSASASASPQGSQRVLEKKDSSSPQRRWNANAQRSSHRRRESLSSNSLMSLKAYYCKLRTFKGTVKALINLRRLPTFVARTGTLEGAGAVLAKRPERIDSAAMTPPPQVVDAVVKLSDDETALQTVQNQVKTLVENGHVITQRDAGKHDDVTYRLQGNLEHYTEENLRKRVKLQEHVHMVALTQRLWLSANHAQEDHLSFGEYEAYMLRLHRLILPEFNIAQSTALIKNDWARDTNGSESLDYRFFHFSMFELVDLWTDTVDAADYISLLYCIMHSLTFERNGHHILKDLDDINPMDILDASKEVTLDEIERDLAREVNGDDAQMYRDRIACDEDDATVKGDDGDDEANGTTHESESEMASASTSNSQAGLIGGCESDLKQHATTKSTANLVGATKSPQPSPPRSTNSTRQGQARPKTMAATASSPSKAALTVKSPREGPHGSPSRPSAILTRDLPSPNHTGTTTPAAAHALNTTTAALNGNVPLAHTAGAAQPTVVGGSELESARLTSTGPLSSDFSLDLQGQRQGPTSGARGSNALLGASLHGSLHDGGQQYAGNPNGNTGPISILSVGSGGEYLSMVSKPGYLHKQSALGAGFNSQHGSRSSSAMGHQVWGQGLLAGDEDRVYTYARSLSQSYEAKTQSFGPLRDARVHGSAAAGRASLVSPRPPQSPRMILKESEARQGSLLIAGDSQRSVPFVYEAQGNLSPRARSAKAQARSSQSSTHPQFYVNTSSSGEQYSDGAGGSVSPLSAYSLDSPKLTTDPQSLMVGGQLSAQMSILSRPTTTSPSSSSRVSSIQSSGALEGFLQTRAFKELGVSLTNSPRTASRGSQLYQQRMPYALVEDLAINTLGFQARAVASVSPHARPTIIHVASPSQRAFSGAVMGANTGTLTLEATAQMRLPGRISMTKTTQGSSRRPDGFNSRRSAGMALSGAPVQLSFQIKSSSPRSARPTK